MTEAVGAWRPPPIGRLDVQGPDPLLGQLGQEEPPATPNQVDAENWPVRVPLRKAVDVSDPSSER